MSEAAIAAAPASTSSAPTQAPAETKSSTGGTTSANPITHASATPETPKAATPPPKPEAPEFFEVKVNGKIIKMTRQEAIDHASMSYAANDRFNEAKRMKGQIDKIISKAKENPIEALMDPALGLTKEQVRDAFEKWYYKDFVEVEHLTEEQKKARQTESELEQYKSREKEYKERQQKQEEDRLTAIQREQLNQQLIEAMESSGLPKTKFFVSRMAFYMRQNAANGWEAPMDYIVRQVKNERASIMSDLATEASAEQLISMLGDGVINKIRQHDLKQLRERRNLPPPTPQAQQAPSDDEERTGKRIYYNQVIKNLQDIQAGRL